MSDGQRAYCNFLIDSGIDPDHTYRIESVIDRLHELVSVLGEDQKIVIQNLLGSECIEHLESYGNLTSKQACLYVRKEDLFPDVEFPSISRV